MPVTICIMCLDCGMVPLMCGVFTSVADKLKVEKPIVVEQRIRPVKKFEPINIDDYLQRLEGNLKLYVQQLQDEKCVCIFLQYAVLHFQNCLNW